MDIEGRLTEIRELMRKNSNPLVAEKYRKYFVEGYDPYGVDASTTVEMARKIVAEGITIAEAMALCKRLVASGKYEEGHLAISIVKRMHEHYTKDTFDEIAGWFEVGIGNWAHVDGLSGDVVSVLLNRKIASLQDIEEWERSCFKYQRRTVPVSLIKTVGVSFDVNEVITTVEPLMTDPEKVVQQGMGWLLREIWKKYPGPVEELLLKYRQTGPRVIFQYATEKMSPERKESFRRGKKV